MLPATCSSKGANHVTQCPCGSGRSYETCCGPYITQSEQPATAEALMRARYSAYALGNFDYLGKTFAPSAGAQAHVKSAQDWAARARFEKLKVLATAKGGAGDRVGTVEFLATYEEDGRMWEHHEVSEFARDSQGRWRFIAGDGHRHAAGEGHSHHHGHHHHHQDHGGHTLRRAEPKVGRNDPCPCGSGKKYKKCCGA